MTTSGCPTLEKELHNAVLIFTTHLSCAPLFVKTCCQLLLGVFSLEYVREDDKVRLLKSTEKMTSKDILAPLLQRRKTPTRNGERELEMVF